VLHVEFVDGVLHVRMAAVTQLPVSQIHQSRLRSGMGRVAREASLFRFYRGMGKPNGSALVFMTLEAQLIAARLEKLRVLRGMRVMAREAFPRLEGRMLDVGRAAHGVVAVAIHAKLSTAGDHPERLRRGWRIMAGIAHGFRNGRMDTGSEKLSLFR